MSLVTERSLYPRQATDLTIYICTTKINLFQVQTRVNNKPMLSLCSSVISLCSVCCDNLLLKGSYSNTQTGHRFLLQHISMIVARQLLTELAVHIILRCAAWILWQILCQGRTHSRPLLQTPISYLHNMETTAPSSGGRVPCYWSPVTIVVILIVLSLPSSLPSPPSVCH